MVHKVDGVEKLFGKILFERASLSFLSWGILKHWNRAAQFLLINARENTYLAGMFVLMISQPVTNITSSCDAKKEENTKSDFENISSWTLKPASSC